LDLERCCSELQQQLVKGKLVKEPLFVGEEKLIPAKRYYTGESTVEYFVNMKAYWYCYNRGYAVN
jgi:hypothetical protein